MGQEEKTTDFESLMSSIRDFVDEREWDRFHNIKDLAVGLSVEAGELLEQTLWQAPDEISRRLEDEPRYREAVLDEVADVLIFTLRLCDKMGVTPADIIPSKLQKNAEK